MAIVGRSVTGVRGGEKVVKRHMKEPMIDHDTEKRLTSVEVELSSVKDVLFSFKKDFDDKFESLFQAVGHIRDRHIEATRPQWGVYFSVITIVLVIIGMIGSGYIRDQYRMEESQKQLIEAFTKHTSELGHAGANVEIQRVHDKLWRHEQRLDELQRQAWEHAEADAEDRGRQSESISQSKKDIDWINKELLPSRKLRTDP